MRSAVIVFPASNCDRDVAVALETVCDAKPTMVWHADADIPDVDLIVLPGGFSYGDYLRCGAMAARSPVMQEIKRRADQGVAILGICNGFQILAESGLLPGALMRNMGLNYICKTVDLTVTSTKSPFTNGYQHGEKVAFPIAHNDGNYVADPDTLKTLQDQDRIAFTYHGDNPNGSAADIAGITSADGRILGMMPHPERVIDPATAPTTGSEDGYRFFKNLLTSVLPA